MSVVYPDVADVACKIYTDPLRETSVPSKLLNREHPLLLESVPSATSREVKKFLSEQWSVVVPDSLFEDTKPSIGTTSYWFTYYNLRGAKRRVLRDRSASDAIPSISGTTVTGISGAELNVADGGTGTTLSVKAIDISEDPENSDVSSANTNVLVTIQNQICGVKGAGLA